METPNQHWIHRLSEVVDDTLPPAEAEAARRHLRECGACRRTLAELRRVVATAATLPPRPPDRDLWPGIERAVAARSDIGRGPSRGRRRPSRTSPTHGTAPRRFLLSLPQLTAAAAVLILVSSLVTWWVRPAMTDPVGEPGTVAPSALPAASVQDEVDTDRASRIQALTQALDQAGEALDPHTLRLLDKNLAVIDRAIEESRRALALDPGNAFLEDHLDRAQDRKLSYLVEATGIVRWARS